MAFQSYDDAGFGATLNLEEIAADGRYLFYIFFDIIIITACPAKWVPDYNTSVDVCPVHTPILPPIAPSTVEPSMSIIIRYRLYYKLYGHYGNK